MHMRMHMHMHTHMHMHIHMPLRMHLRRKGGFVEHHVSHLSSRCAHAVRALRVACRLLEPHLTHTPV